MNSLAIFLILLGFLWLLAGIALLLHRLHPRTGLTPLMMYLGAIAAVMQLQGLRAIELQFESIRITLDAAVLLPVLLFGVLIVYITNGSVRGRSAALGIILISGLEIIFQAVIDYLPQESAVNIIVPIQKYSLRIISASAVTLAITLMVLLLSYQSISNLRQRYPSRMASGLALLLALLVDAMIFSTLAWGGSNSWLMMVQSQIIEKLLAGLALWPLLVFYLYRIAPRLPDSAATYPRPIFDFFTTNLQLEVRARYHYNLLRTLSQINQLIIRSTNRETLLQKTCDALLELRDYHMVWMGLMDRQSGKLSFCAYAGFSEEQIEEYVRSGQMSDIHANRIQLQPTIINEITDKNGYSASWRNMMLATGCRAAATFPMRYTGQMLGILNVCMDRPNSFSEIEIDLLQELADDLAYALVSLEARNQQALLQTSAETMQDGLLILNTAGEIIYANRIIAQFIAAQQVDLTGKHVSSILSPQQAKTIPEAYAVLLEKGMLAFDIEYQFDHGAPLIASVNASLGKDTKGEPDHIVANIRNVTAQRKYEHQLLSLHQLTTDLVQIHDPQILSNMFLKVSEDLLNADASGIYLVDPETKVVTETLTHNLPTEYSQRIARSYRGLPGETALKTSQPVFVNDTLNDHVYGERITFMADFGIRALLILPILFQETYIGALTVYYHQPRAIPHSDLQIGLTLAHTLAIVYQNAMLYQAEHKQRVLAEALIQAAASINSSLDLELVLDQLLEQVMRVIPCTAANIIMIEKDTGYIHSHRGYEHLPNFDEFLENIKFPLKTKNIAIILNQGEPYLISDISQNENWVTYPGTEWVQGYAGAPLIVNKKVVGILNVDSDKPNFFTEETIDQLRVFANYAATAIKNARLYQAELSQREFAEALTQAAASVNSSLEFVDVLNLVLEQTMRVIPCQAANIMLIEGEKVFLVRHRGYENFVTNTAFFDNREFPLEWPGLQEMYMQGQPIFMADTYQDERWQPTPETDWVRSFIGIPLKVDQQVVGFLNLDSDQPNFLQEPYLPRLQTFADYASTAIKNARTFESSQRRAEEMAALVIAASAVSKSLDFMQVLQIIAEQMTKVLQVKACAISDYDPIKNQITLLLEHTPDDWKVNADWYQPYDLEQYPLTRHVLENNEPIQLRINDPKIDESEKLYMEKTGIGSLLMLPLVSQDRTIGLVELIDTEKERLFSSRSIALGLSLASHAATAIENAGLYRRLQEHASELEESVQKRTQQLQAATDYIEGILASVPDAIFVIDPNQQVVRANQAGERLLQQAQATGLDLFNPQLLEILEKEGGPNVQSIIEVQGKAYQARSSQLRSTDNQTKGQVIIFRDVTHFRELDQMKTQFVSDVSHELRTPLTNLTLYLGLLTTVRDAKKQSDYILTLQRETDRLTHLIEDLLTISRLEASRIRFQIRPTDINQLLENLVCDRAILAAQKEIQLDFTPYEELSLASADKNMLTQALSNLLTNAVNYTLPSGSIHVFTAQPEPDWISIQISDTGVGIPPEEIEHIFDRFYRGSASQQTGAEGTGLGLAISEEIIHRMGGKISLVSTPGAGSTFTIWLRAASGEML